MIVVKIMQLNCPVETYALQPGATVQDLFEESNKEYVEGEVTRRHQRVSENDTLFDGDVIMISKMTKGNQDLFEVEILRISGGGRVLTLTAQPGYTIKQVLDQLPTEDRAQFFRADGTSAYEFRLSGAGSSSEPVPMTYALNAPAGGKVRILCSQVVKGN